MLISSDTNQSIGFSPEIICEIISYLHDDKKTLLTLGLVSKQTLYESRPLLFSTVDFSEYGSPGGFSVWKPDFHRFLRLVDVAWTSLTPTIQCITIRYLNNRPDYDEGTTRRGIPLARVLTNLQNVKSLRLSNLKRSHVSSYILEFVLQLPAEHLSLFWCDASNIPQLLSRLSSSLKTLDMTGMSFADHRHFRDSTLDSRSLFLFKSAWDPSICRDLDIKVKTFHLCPSHDQSHGSAKMTNVIQEFLSALPSPRLLQDIRIAVKLVTPSLEEDLTMLELFEWSSLVETTQRLFPSLKKLAIRIGAHSPSQNPNPYLELLRRYADVQQLEKEGLIELCAI